MGLDQQENVRRRWEIPGKQGSVFRGDGKVAARVTSIETDNSRAFVPRALS